MAGIRPVTLATRVGFIGFAFLLATCTQDQVAPSPGPASLEFTGQPTDAVAGASISPAVEVEVLDDAGNPVLDFDGEVTIQLGANPGGGVLAGTTTVVVVDGVASFADLSIDVADTGYTLEATATDLDPVISDPFAITPGPATELAFTLQPLTGTAGVTLSPAVQVTARDALGNTATDFTDNVTVAISAGATLSGTTTLAAVAGVATFSDLSIDQAGTGYVLTASSGSLTAATSASITIASDAPTQLVFSEQPSSALVGSVITPAVRVSAQDAFGNVNTSFTGSVTVAIGTNPSGGALFGTVTVAAVGGVATFSNLSIDMAGVGYTLTASSGSLTPATSAAFTITPAAATRLVFTVQAATHPAGQVITPAVEVSALDPQGNIDVAFTGNVTVAIGTNPSGGTLSGTLTVEAVAGVATFSDLSIDQARSGYTLTAGSGSLTSATSAAFTITAAPATQLVFTVQPVTTTAGQAITPVVQVTAQDGLGNTDAAFTGNVTVAIGTNPSGGTLSGTLTVGAVAGVATFSDLSIDQAGVGYTLTASSGSLTSATSAAFGITAGAATQLVFTVQPVTTTAGQAITPAVEVSAQDALGNIDVAFTGNVTVVIGNNPSGGTLTGALSVGAVSGVATFSSLGIDQIGVGYTLTVSSGSLTPATSTAFNIVASAATLLEFSVPPSTTIAGETIAPDVEVTAKDAFGNTDAAFTGNVTVAIGTNPSGGALFGTVTVAAVGGIATFSTLSIDKAGVGYTLTASSGSLTSATSAAFGITAGAATQLVFTVQPVTTTAGQAITPAVQVSAQDALGNTTPTFAGNVTVAIGTNPATGTLSGTATVAAVNGVASFSDLSMDKAGVGYTLTASSGSLTGATSAAFTITAGAATELAITLQPANTMAGAAITPAVQVSARDPQGNTDATFTGNVTVAIGANPATGILSGTLTVGAVAGVATFSDLSIDQAGVGYTLTASSGVLTGATSAAFTITSGPVPGTITHTLLTAGNNPANLAVYTTASISPAPNALVTVAVMTHHQPALASPTLSGGGMTNWEVVSTIIFDGVAPLKRLTIYRAMSASPGSGPLTITSSGTVSHCQWIVSQWDGVDTTGVNGAGAIAQTGSDSGTAVSGLTMPLAPFGSANNAAYGVFGVNSNALAITPGAGFTAIAEQPSGEGTLGDLFAEWAVNLNAISASWTTRNAGALGVEIKARTGP